MAKAGKVYHWKHGWIPISPEAKAFSEGKGPKPVIPKRTPATHKKLGMAAAAEAKYNKALKSLQSTGRYGKGWQANAHLAMMRGDQQTNASNYTGAGLIPPGLSLKINNQNEIPQYLKMQAAAGELIKSIHEKGGFTFNPRTGGLVQVGDVDGFAVAVPGTEREVGGPNTSRQVFVSDVSRLIEDHAQDLADGAFIGGWYSEDRKKYMVEMTQLVPDRKAAIELGKARNQEGVFDMKTGEFVPTGGTGG